MLTASLLLFFLAFNWNISAGSMVAMVGSILAVAVMLKSGGPWKSVAEGLQAKNTLLEEQNKLLKAENDALAKKTDVQGVMQLVGQVAGSVAAMAKHVGDLGRSLNEGRSELDESRKDASQVATAITSTLQQFGVILRDLQQEMAEHRAEAQERREQWQQQHDAIMAELRRAPTARTRHTDVRDGA